MCVLVCLCIPTGDLVVLSLLKNLGSVSSLDIGGCVLCFFFFLNKTQVEQLKNVVQSLSHSSASIETQAMGEGFHASMSVRDLD